MEQAVVGDTAPFEHDGDLVLYPAQHIWVSQDEVQRVCRSRGGGFHSREIGQHRVEQHIALVGRIGVVAAGFEDVLQQRGLPAATTRARVSRERESCSAPPVPPVSAR